VRRFRIVPGRSRVETETRSNVHPIHAAASRLSGVIEGDIGPGGEPNFELPHRATLAVPIDAMESGNALQDMEMQRRMDARSYPHIEIVVNRAWKLPGDGQCRATFEVSAHGRSREYEEDFTLRVDGNKLFVDGEHTFDMRDFGVSPPRFLMMKVDPEVKVRMRIEAEEVS
jgi:polyisoprenoid-binding protein YceI